MIDERTARALQQSCRRFAAADEVLRGPDPDEDEIVERAHEYIDARRQHQIMIDQAERER